MRRQLQEPEPSLPAPTRGHRLALDPRLPLREALAVAFADVVGYALTLIESAASQPGHAVHEYRKSVRRARALLRLSEPMLRREESRELAAELRRAQGISAPSRDAQVLLGAFRKLQRGHGGGEARAALEAMLMQERARAADPVAVQQELRRGARLLAGLPERYFAALPANVRWRDVEHGLARSFRRARRARRAARRGGASADVHVWRKRIKELRYQLELLEASGDVAREEHRALVELSERLGTVTDLELLEAWMDAHRSRVDPELAGRVAKRIGRQRRRRVEKLLAGSRSFFGRRAKRFAARVARARGRAA